MVTERNGGDWLEKSSHPVPGTQCQGVEEEEEPCQGMSLLGDTLLRGSDVHTDGLFYM